jgi:hypothetical protein
MPVTLPPIVLAGSLKLDLIGLVVGKARLIKLYTASK